MRIIFIYGPPAVGKLTVAKSLKEITEFKLIHNHLIFDLLEEVFQPFSEPFIELRNEINFNIIKVCKKNNINGIIMTHCYNHPEQASSIEILKSFIDKIGIEISFVQLIAQKEKLIERVKFKNRKIYKKLNSKKDLINYFKIRDFFTPIQNVYSLKIDNTDLLPNQVANIILKELDLNDKKSN